jgi:hypothetical protein
VATALRKTFEAPHLAPKEIMDTLEESALKNMKTFDPLRHSQQQSEVANTLWAYATMGWAEATLGEFKPQEVTNTDC